MTVIHSRISILGYVIRPAQNDPWYMDTFHGRDITTSIYLHTKNLAFWGDDMDR